MRSIPLLLIGLWITASLWGQESPYKPYLPPVGFAPEFIKATGLKSSTVLDGEGKVAFQHVFDENGRLISFTEASSIFTYERDEKGNLLSIEEKSRQSFTQIPETQINIMPGRRPNSKRWVFRSFGEERPSRKLEFVYDESGRVIERVHIAHASQYDPQPGQKWTYEGDNAKWSEFTTAEFQDSPSMTYSRTFDASGRIAREYEILQTGDTSAFSTFRYEGPDTNFSHMERRFFAQGNSDKQELKRLAVNEYLENEEKTMFWMASATFNAYLNKWEFLIYQVSLEDGFRRKTEITTREVIPFDKENLSFDFEALDPEAQFMLISTHEQEFH